MKLNRFLIALLAPQQLLSVRNAVIEDPTARLHSSVRFRHRHRFSRRTAMAERSAGPRSHTQHMLHTWSSASPLAILAKSGHQLMLGSGSAAAQHFFSAYSGKVAASVFSLVAPKLESMACGAAWSQSFCMFRLPHLGLSVFDVDRAIRASTGSDQTVSTYLGASSSLSHEVWSCRRPIERPS